MAASSTPSSPAADGDLKPYLDAGNTWLANAMQLYTLQWQGLLSWQNALTQAQRDLWDGWVRQVSGGVPLDG